MAIRDYSVNVDSEVFMLHTKPFIRRILLLGVLPICLATVLLLFGFAQAQRHQIKLVQQAILTVLENSLVAPSLEYENNPALLRQAATALLYLDPITHIALVNKDATVIENFGLPFNINNIHFDISKNVILI